MGSMTWTWRQTKQMLSERRRALDPPKLPPSAANPTGAPTRPDRLSIWPTEEETFGIDVLYTGAQGWKRADVVKRQIESLGLDVTMRQEGERGWIIRFGPVSREDMLTVLNGYVW
jgi:hypothetical protein